MQPSQPRQQTAKRKSSKIQLTVDSSEAGAFREKSARLFIANFIQKRFLPKLMRRTASERLTEVPTNRIVSRLDLQSDSRRATLTNGFGRCGGVARLALLSKEESRSFDIYCSVNALCAEIGLVSAPSTNARRTARPKCVARTPFNATLQKNFGLKGSHDPRHSLISQNIPR